MSNLLSKFKISKKLKTAISFSLLINKTMYKSKDINNLFFLKIKLISLYFWLKKKLKFTNKALDYLIWQENFTFNAKFKKSKLKNKIKINKEVIF